MTDIICYTRRWLGPDLKIVILSLSKEDRRERVLSRHAGDAEATKMMDVGLRIWGDFKF